MAQRYRIENNNGNLKPIYLIQFNAHREPLHCYTNKYFPPEKWKKGKYSPKRVYFRHISLLWKLRYRISGVNGLIQQRSEKLL